MFVMCRENRFHACRKLVGYHYSWMVFISFFFSRNFIQIKSIGGERYYKQRSWSNTDLPETKSKTALYLLQHLTRNLERKDFHMIPL